MDTLLGFALGAMANNSSARKIQKSIEELRPDRPGFQERVKKLSQEAQGIIKIAGATQPRLMFLANMWQFSPEIAAGLAADTPTLQPVDQVFYITKDASGSDKIFMFENSPKLENGITNIGDAKLPQGNPALIYGVGIGYTTIGEGENLKTKLFNSDLPGVFLNGHIEVRLGDRLLFNKTSNMIFKTEGSSDTLPYKNTALLSNPKVWQGGTSISADIHASGNSAAGAAYRLYFHAIQVVKS